MKRVDIPSTITIEFTREELEALLRVCGRVGGSLSATRRRHIAAFSDLAYEAGITYDYNDGAIEGSVRFLK